MTDSVTFKLSGAQVRIVREGNWPNEQPAAWATIEAAPFRKVGVGRSYTVELPADVALDLADYLWSVYEVNDSIAYGEDRNMQIGNTAKAAADAVRAALVEAGR